MGIGEYKAGKDIMDHLVIINDLIDTVSSRIKGIEGSGVFFEKEKSKLEKKCLNALAYNMAVEDFIKTHDPIMLANALSKFDESIGSVKAALHDMGRTLGVIIPEIKKAKDSDSLKVVAEIIKTAIPVLMTIKAA